MPETPHDAGMSPKSERWALAGILLGALVLRLIRLGALADAGDEETTTLGAMALLRGFPPVLPGGAIYIRELPFTFIEAAILKVAGLNEFALRLVPALVAAPRIAALWWLARPFLGARGALLAAGLLAVAPLDFELSRITRMYSLFATFDLLFVAAVVHMALGARRAGLATGAGLLSMATHVLTVTHAPVAWAAAVGRDVPRRAKVALVSVGAIVVASFLVLDPLIERGYAAAGPSLRIVDPHPGLVAGRLIAIGEAVGTPLRMAVAALAVLLAAYLVSRALRGMTTAGGKSCVLVAALAFLAGAPVVGGVLLLALALLEGIPSRTLLRRTASSIVPLAVACCAMWFLAVLTAPESGGVGSALRFLLGFPYPNWYDIVQAAPLLSTLAGFGVLLAVDRAAQGPTQGAWIGLIAAAACPPLVTGLITREDALRYEIHVLAPILVLGVLASLALASRFVRPGVKSIALAGALMLVAVRPDQTFRAMFRDYGPVTEPFAVLNVAPDHKGAAEFVLAHAAPSDWIVAEDMLEQYLYIGRTEVWLRRREDASQFLQGGAPDGIPRDVYTGAMHAHDLDAVAALASSHGVRSIWLITSAEVEAAPQYYRTAATDATLLRWRPQASFVGQDGMTRVFRMVDGSPVPPAGGGASR